MKSQVIAIVFASLLAGCSKETTQPATQPATTASPSTSTLGKHFTVTNVARVSFPKGGDALVLQCNTDVPIEDKVALRQQVDEIWESFRKDVERASLTNGVIRMNHPGTGMVSVSKVYGFVFVKRADGKWHCLEDDKKK